MNISGRSRRFTFCLGSAVVLALPACGGSGDRAAPASEQAAAPASRASSAPSIDFATCGGFGIDDVARIFGVPAQGYEASHGEESWGTECSFSRPDDVRDEQVVRFTLSRSASAAEAAEEMADLASNAGVADEVLASEDASHRVAELGDEALWVAANGCLYVRSGDVTITVTSPRQEALQMDVARALIGR